MVKLCKHHLLIEIIHTNKTCDNIDNDDVFEEDVLSLVQTNMDIILIDVKAINNEAIQEEPMNDLEFHYRNFKNDGNEE